MKALKDCEYKENALKIAIDPDALERRNVEEQILLMKATNDCEKEYVLKMSTDENVLTTKTVEEQELLIKVQNDEITQFETHSKKLSKINTLEELKEYVNSLQKEYGSEKDIKLNDKVKTYK